MDHEPRESQRAKKIVEAAQVQLERFGTAGKIDYPPGFITAAITLYDRRDFLEDPSKTFEEIRRVGRNKEVWKSVYEELIEIDQDQAIAEDLKVHPIQIYLGLAKILGIDAVSPNIKAALADLEARYPVKPEPQAAAIVEEPPVSTEETVLPDPWAEAKPAVQAVSLQAAQEDGVTAGLAGDGGMELDQAGDKESDGRAKANVEVPTADEAKARDAEQERIRMLLNKSPWDCSAAEIDERDKILAQQTLQANNPISTPLPEIDWFTPPPDLPVPEATKPIPEELRAAQANTDRMAQDLARKAEEAATQRAVVSESSTSKEIIILGQEAIGKSPEEMINQINQELSASRSREVSLQTTPQAVLDYLKTVDLPYGAKIKGSTKGQIRGSEFIINGAVGTILGDAKFDVTFRQTTDGKLVVSGKPNIDIAWALGRVLKSRKIDLVDMITHLDQIATEKIGEKVDYNWGLTGFGIAGDKLAFDFKRKS